MRQKGKNFSPWTVCFTYTLTSTHLISLNFLGEQPIIVSKDTPRLSAGEGNDNKGSHAARGKPVAEVELPLTEPSKERQKRKP